MNRAIPPNLTRTFWIDQQPCLIHLPEQPNGFLVLYLGDAGQYVEHDRSFWQEHPNRSKVLQELLLNGYTLFTSNLYGNHWGSPDAVDLLEQVYQSVIRKEITNPYIHIIAEGMGALPALEWQQKFEKARTMVLITPCIYLKALYESEQKNQVFYKRLQKELASSYHVKQELIHEEVISKYSKSPINLAIPTKIYHDISNPYYPFQIHSRPFETYQTQRNVLVQLMLSVKPVFPKVLHSMHEFMSAYENRLDHPV